MLGQAFPVLICLSVLVPSVSATPTSVFVAIDHQTRGSDPNDILSTLRSHTGGIVAPGNSTLLQPAAFDYGVDIRFDYLPAETVGNQRTIHFRFETSASQLILPGVTQDLVPPLSDGFYTLTWVVAGLEDPEHILGTPVENSYTYSDAAGVISAGSFSFTTPLSTTLFGATGFVPPSDPSFFRGDRSPTIFERSLTYTIPEPATAALFSAGALLFARQRRRRK